MKLDMVGVIVENMANAILFYERLGFKALDKTSSDYVELDNDGVRISLNSKKMIEGIYGYVPESTGDKIELAFLCKSTAEIDEVCKRMADFGYEIVKQPWHAFWGQYYAMVKDVDGNILSLFVNESE